MNVTEIAKMDGVRDLTPAKVRLYFARALQHEMQGKTKEAQEYLERAVAAAE